MLLVSSLKPPKRKRQFANSLIDPRNSDVAYYCQCFIRTVLLTFKFTNTLFVAAFAVLYLLKPPNF